MSYVRKKKIKGRIYYYLVESKREGKKVRQIHKKYLGSGKGVWHKKREVDLIVRFGGEPNTSIGPDGKFRGKPVEVKCGRSDKRYRLGEGTHKKLVRDDGYYIFDAKGERFVMMPAKKVDEMLPSGDWFKDREYPHKFVTQTQIFDSTHS